MARFAAVLATLAVLVSGCGKTTIDAGKAEDFVRTAFGQPTPRSVHCPSGVEAKNGRTIACTAVLPNGKRYTVTLHVVGGARVEVGQGDVHPAK